MKGRLIDLSMGLNRRQRVTVEVDGDFRADFDKLKDSEISLDIKKFRLKRSNDANKYCWVLLDKLAVVLQSTKEELYLQFVQKYGIFRDYHLLPDEADSFRTAWSLLGTGWPTEQTDYTPDGQMLVIRAYYGSSRYNTKQMARLIDAIVDECKRQGIETLTPEELERMKGAWK